MTSFKDYYLILEISNTATFDEIKSSYRRLSLLYHPDKNLGKDTTSIMQDINEAYYILKDDIKRARYDQEYRRFKNSVSFKDSIKQDNNTFHKNNTTEKNSNSAYDKYRWEYTYDVYDDNVRQDISDARIYAKEIIDKFIKNIKQDSVKAAKGAWSEMESYIIVAIVWFIISIIIIHSI